MRHNNRKQNFKFFHTALFLIAVLLFSTSVLADVQQTYNMDGLGSAGNIASSSTQNFISVDTLSSANEILSPIEADYDNNGDIEIISVNNDNIIIISFNQSSTIFNIEDSYNVGAELLTQFYYFENVLYFVTSNNWHKLEWNGTDFTHSNISQTFANDDVGFGCGELNNDIHCFAVTNSGTGASARIKLYSINWTNENVSTYTEPNYVTGCLSGEDFELSGEPELRKVEVFDQDDNSNFDQIAFTWRAPCTGASIGDKSFVSILESDFTTWNLIDLNTYGCKGGRSWGLQETLPITAPFFYDIDKSKTGYELSVGCMVETDEFEVNTFNGLSFSHIDEFPDDLTFSDVDGTIVSNLMQINCMGTDSPLGDDIGVLGFDEDEEELNFMCYNTQSSGFDSREFSNYAVSDASVTTGIIYSANLGGSLDSIFTSYGVFSLNTGSVYGGDLSPNLVGSIAGSNSIHRPTYSTVDNPLDLLVLTPSNIYYFDDGFENSAPSLYYDGTPCNIIKNNETVLVTLRAVDTDGDDVRYKIISYYDELNEYDSNWTSYLPSGTTVQLSFIANQSTQNSELKLMVQDDNDDEVKTTTLTYNYIVSSDDNSNEAYDCYFSGTSISDTTDDELTINEVIAETNEDFKTQWRIYLFLVVCLVRLIYY